MSIKIAGSVNIGIHMDVCCGPESYSHPPRSSASTVKYWYGIHEDHTGIPGAIISCYDRRDVKSLHSLLCMVFHIRTVVYGAYPGYRLDTQPQ